MATGKKQKTKWKAVDASQLLNPTTRKVTTSNWADESNDHDGDSIDFGRKAEVNLPTAPRAARGPENDAKIPHDPPYQAYLSNLSYEVTETDLAEFFSHLKVKRVRLPRDDRGNTIRAKGFGYVEFEDRGSLIEALSLPDTNLKNRRMRIEVAEGDQGRDKRGQRDRTSNDSDRTLGDWRSGPRTDSDLMSSDRDGYKSGRREYGSYGDRRGGGSFRDDDRGSFRRDGDRQGFRDSRSFRDDRSNGGIYRSELNNGDRYEKRSFEDRKDFGGERKAFSGGDRRDYGGAGDRRDYGGAGDRRDYGGAGDRRDYGGAGDRRDYGGAGDRRDASGGSERTWRRDDPKVEKDGIKDADPKGEIKTRIKLNLQPRTRPVEERVNGDVPSKVVSPPGNTSASIFGGARPVDTSAREREIEERLAKQRDDTSSTTQDEMKAQTPSSSQKEEGPVSAVLEPAPPPKENVWTRRSQVKNGRASPHEEGEVQKGRSKSPSTNPSKSQPPRRNLPDDVKQDEKLPGLRGGNPTQKGGGGAGTRHIETKNQTPQKSKEHKNDISDATVKLPKVQENKAPNFIGSNKYAFLEDFETTAE